MTNVGKKNLFKGRGIDFQIDKTEFDKNAFRVKMEFLLREIKNPIRESVTASRAPHIEIDGKESIREDLIQNEILYDTLETGTTANAKNKIEGDNPFIKWERTHKKYNCKLWVPEKNRSGKTHFKAIEALYDFWDIFLNSYKNETDSKKEEGYKPCDKVFEFLEKSWKPDLNDLELREIQLKVEEMTLNFKVSTVLKSTPQLKALFFNGVSAKDFLLESLEDKKELEKVRNLPAWGIEPVVIWVLSKLFNVFALEKKSVQLARLIDKLDTSVREYMTEMEGLTNNVKSVKEVRTKQKKDGLKKDLKEPKQELKLPETGYNPETQPETGEKLETGDVTTVKGESMDDRPITSKNKHSKHNHPKGNKKEAIGKGSKKKKAYAEEKGQIQPIGRILVNWLLSKELVSIYSSNVDIKMGKKDCYLKQPSYVNCEFDIKQLPLNIELPMVYPPLDLKIRRRKVSNSDQALNKQRLRDLAGGYLYSDPKLGGSFSKSASVLSTHDDKNFDIQLVDEKIPELTRVLNKLQGVAFKINKLFLKKLEEDWDTLQKNGLVMPKILDSLDRREARRRLHLLYMQHPEISSEFDFPQLSKILFKNIQEAQYEQNILKLARAYANYNLYFPCFLDFRGRNYRFGPFHFHERDLVRSLIVFADPGVDTKLERADPGVDTNLEGADQDTNSEDNVRARAILENTALAAAFHLTKKFENYQHALKFAIQYILEILLNQDIENSFQWQLETARCARNPFQYMACCQLIVTFQKVRDGRDNAWYYIQRFPHQLDASASAYQLISYFLGDLQMAQNTNLIPDPPDQIHDIYMAIEKGLKEYFLSLQTMMQTRKQGEIEEKQQGHASKNEKDCYELEYAFLEKIEPKILGWVSTFFDRCIVKKIFMPIVYGKSIFSTSKDLDEKIGRYLTSKEVGVVSRICYLYWGKVYSDMKSLMRLVSCISWVAAANQQTVKYSTKYWVTHQDYVTHQPVRITLRYHSLDPKPNAKAKAKRAVVTLRIPTRHRSTRKSAISTFANFIHQKDALTAIIVVNTMMKIGKNPAFNNLDFSKAPIYSVHDNFVTTPLYANYLPYIYRRSFLQMGHPLIILNKFIYDNIIAPSRPEDIEDIEPKFRDEFKRISKVYNCNQPNPKECYPLDSDFLSYCLELLAAQRSERATNKKNQKAAGKQVKSTAKAEGNGENPSDNDESEGENENPKTSMSEWIKKNQELLYNYDIFSKAFSSPNRRKNWVTLSQGLDRPFHEDDYCVHY